MGHKDGNLHGPSFLVVLIVEKGDESALVAMEWPLDREVLMEARFTVIIVGEVTVAEGHRKRPLGWPRRWWARFAPARTAREATTPSGCSRAGSASRRKRLSEIATQASDVQPLLVQGRRVPEG